MISDGIMKSFQEARKAKMPTVAFIGASSGKISLQKICQVVAPSSRALSSSSQRDRAQEGGEQQELNESSNMMCRIVTPTGLSRPAQPGQLDLRQRDHRERDEHRGEQVEERERKKRRSQLRAIA